MTGLRWTEDQLREHQAKVAGRTRVIDRDSEASNDPQAKVRDEAKAVGRDPRHGSGQNHGTADAERASREPALRKAGGERRLLQRNARPCALGGDVTGGERPATKSRRKRNRPEQKLQIAAVNYLNASLPKDWRVVHVPNGVAAQGKKAKIANSIRKAMGVRAGFTDLIILGPPNRFVVAEAKFGRGELSDDQEEWRDWFLSIGAPWFVFRTIEELVAGCVDAGVPLRGRLS